jgi:hypothetical protein
MKYHQSMVRVPITSAASSSAALETIVIVGRKPSTIAIGRRPAAPR